MALEIGGMKGLFARIDDLDREIHAKMQIPDPSIKLLKEIEDLQMRRRRLCRRVGEKEAIKKSFQGY